jgi:hypothetical protein
MKLFLFLLLALFNNGFQANYNVPTAIQMAKLCAVSYCPEDSVADWSCNWCRHLPDFNLCGLIQNKSTSVFGILGYDTYRSYLVFEGTQDLTDVLYDLQIGKLVPYKEHPSAKVHHGFWNSYQSVRHQIIEKITECSANFPHFSVDNLYITGHSLGSALATITTLDLAETTDIRVKELYSLAGPRVGNVEFVELFNQVIGTDNYYRITSENDPVVHLPFMWMNYKHLDNEYWYPDYMKPYEYINCPLAENTTCADRYKFSLDVEAHRNYLGITRLSFCYDTRILLSQD